MRVFFFLVLLGLSGTGSIAAQSDTGSRTQQVQIHERRAHELLNEKKPELAAKEFAAVLAIDPHNLDAQGNLGVLLYFQSDYAGAEPHLRAAVEQQPDLVKIRTLLGMCEKRLGKMDLARTDLEAVVPQIREPNLRVEAGLELIEIYTATNDLDKAAGIIATLRVDAPTNPEILYAAYRIYSDLASEAMLDMSVAAPDSGQMHQAMAHELARQGDIAGAITAFRAALAANPQLPGIHFELAEALNTSLDPKLKEEAAEQYRLAIVANALDNRALCKLGDIVAAKGDLDEAEGYYKQALAVVPGDTDAEVGLAFIYAQKNDPTTALSLLERVVTADPSNIMAHYRLSSVYRALHRPEDAKRELAEYKKYKDLKEKLRTVYKGLQVDAQQVSPDK